MFKTVTTVIIASFLLIGCGEDIPRPTPKFQKEDIVVSSMNKEITGQVVTVICYRGDAVCQYRVRFEVKMQTVYVQEFEIQFKD